MQAKSLNKSQKRAGLSSCSPHSRPNSIVAVVCFGSFRRELKIFAITSGTDGKQGCATMDGQRIPVVQLPGRRVWFACKAVKEVA